jgi:methionyl-tRNA formyltransferase
MIEDKAKSSALRVHIITEDDPFYLPEFFREFFGCRRDDRIVITGVDLTRPFNRKPGVGLARRLCDFYGLRDSLRLGLRYAAVKAKDAVLPQTLWTGTLPRLLTRERISWRVLDNVNDAAYVATLRRLAPDLLVSVAASQIFKADLLAVPRLQAINIHTGRLPKYRGMMPVFWQMYDGEPDIGITLHTMTPEIDLGEILLSRSVPVRSGASLDEMIRETKRQGADALLELLRRYLDGAVIAAPMDRSQNRYRSFPGRREATAFRQMGQKLL